MSNAPVVGIDLGGTNMQVGVVAPDGSVVGRAKRKTKADKPKDELIARIAETVNRACDDAGVSLADIAGVGIGAPGAIQPNTGVVVEAPNLRWRNVNLASELGAALNGAAVVVENDVNAAIWGENRAGAGENATDLLGVWVGTGVGGGLILGGSLYHGMLGSAGEIGHTLLFPSAPLTFRKLEDVCSRTAVTRRIVHLIQTGSPSMISDLAAQKGRAVTEIGSGTIAQAYGAGDEVTIDVINETADFLGRAISNAVTLLGLPNIVLGGGLTEAMGQQFVERVARSCREHVFPPAAADRLRVVATKLEDDAGLLGAAFIAREALAVTG